MELHLLIAYCVLHLLTFAGVRSQKASGIVEGNRNEVRFIDDASPCPDPPCDPVVCPSKCPAGFVLDHCGCCMCGRPEGSKCNEAAGTNSAVVRHENGFCGDNLECRHREDVPKSVNESTCQCILQDTVCGSDNVTYTSFCKLMAASVRLNKKLHVVHKGACPAAPTISTVPKSQRRKTGEKLSLYCEANGYPLPRIQWIKKVKRERISLPNDDHRVTVNIRGGPEKAEVTGWLQINNVNKLDHEGIYICRAKNDFGRTEALATVKIL